MNVHQVLEKLEDFYKKYGIDPDMAIFGKALGNGYAITAVIGRREIMEAAQTTFISSTFWTERIGPTAALKTLEIMEREKSWEQISEIGNKVANNWSNLASMFKLSLKISGLDSIKSFSFDSDNNLGFKSLITQEMLKKGILATNLFFLSSAHTEEIIDKYDQALYDVFKLIKECENGLDVNSLLNGPTCHAGFRRIN